MLASRATSGPAIRHPLLGLQVIRRHRPSSEFPELIVTVPDAWPKIELAPLYDVHIGHKNWDQTLFEEHRSWIAKSPYVLTWNGGDLIENASKLSVGTGVYEQTLTPREQILAAKAYIKPLASKCLFSLPGNHEQRADQMGFSIAEWMAEDFGAPFFPDYCFCTIKWRKQNFRILAHHGSGAATTAGAQRMAARKAVAWAKVFDIYWTGHLHNALVDMLAQTDYDQRTRRMCERDALVLISPSYLRFFGSYAATKQYPLGSRGLHVIELRDNGTMHASIHARGRRL